MTSTDFTVPFMDGPNTDMMVHLFKVAGAPVHGFADVKSFAIAAERTAHEWFLALSG